MVVITLALLPSNLAHSLDQWKDLGYIAFVSYRSPILPFDLL